MEKHRKRTLLIFIILLILALFISIKIYNSDPNFMLIDQRILEAFISVRSELLTKFMKIISNLADKYFVIATLFILMIIETFKKDRKPKYSVSIIILLFLTLLLRNFLKAYIGRIRPDLSYALIYEDAFSFPSGHAQFATVYYGVFILLLDRKRNLFRKKRIVKILQLLLLLLIILVGTSRLYLGVHYFFDVFAGIILGIMMIILFNQILVEYSQRNGTLK